VQLDLNELRDLLAILNQTDITELTLKSSDFELAIRKGARSESQVVVPPVSSLTTTQTDLATPTSESPPASTAEKKWVEIISPMVGTFYRSPTPDESPFVEVGDVIQRGQTVCIIEAMKLMNELEAEVSGQVMEILVENGEPVEYGQPLMQVNLS
jgi:acetyl-CoA carboxylase biotin carboxyl carrier protein